MPSQRRSIVSWPCPSAQSMPHRGQPADRGESAAAAEWSTGPSRCVLGSGCQGWTMDRYGGITAKPGPTVWRETRGEWK